MPTPNRGLAFTIRTVPIQVHLRNSTECPCAEDTAAIAETGPPFLDPSGWPAVTRERVGARPIRALAATIRRPAPMDFQRPCAAPEAAVRPSQATRERR